jgi:hypothetical protein
VAAWIEAVTYRRIDLDAWLGSSAKTTAIPVID